MTLTEVSIQVRKALPIAILSLLLFLILFYSIQLVFLILNSGKKTPVFTNPTFGIIKKPLIKDASSSAGLSFTLDTIEGRPVTATEAAKVFFLPSSATRFGYREKVYLIAKTFGFNTETTRYRLSGSQAIFSDSTGRLAVDITNFNFTYEYFFDKNPLIFEDAVVATTKESVDEAVNFLRSVGRYPKELSLGKTNTIFFKYDPLTKSMDVVPRGRGSNLVEVDFYRQDEEVSPQPMPFVTSTYFNSPNYVLMLFTPSGYRVLRSQVKFFEKSEEQVATYLLKTADEAYGQLRSGRGVIVSNPLDKNTIIIKKMFLGYFDPDIYQEYLQPVYVFLGDENFAAYVPALKEEYLTE